MNFKEFLNEQNTVGTHNDYATGAYLPSFTTGSDTEFQGVDRQPQLGDIDLVPTVTRSAQIKFIERNKNPILILLADGTRLHLTWDEFKRIHTEPKVGRQMTVTFQRFPGDASESLSQVQHIIVH